MKTNPLSAIGRMSYAGHLALYPVIFGGAYFLYSGWSKSSKEKNDAFIKEAMPKPRAVDPDDFQPFSAIPFHNNPELRYRYADVKMYGYLDKKTQVDLKSYPYKTFHNVYDHDNKKAYYYNWVSMTAEDHA